MAANVTRAREAVESRMNAELEEGVVKLKALLCDGKSRVARPYDVDITGYQEPGM